MLTDELMKAATQARAALVAPPNALVMALGKELAKQAQVVAELRKATQPSPVLSSLIAAMARIVPNAQRTIRQPAFRLLSTADFPAIDVVPPSRKIGF